MTQFSSLYSKVQHVIFTYKKVVAAAILFLILSLTVGGFIYSQQKKDNQQVSEPTKQGSYSIILLNAETKEEIRGVASTKQQLTSVISSKDIGQAEVVTYSIFLINGEQKTPIQGVQIDISDSGDRAVSVPQLFQPGKYEFLLQKQDGITIATQSIVVE